ncbi:Uma2 family endonuclease [Tepidimonas sp.]|uniref:Uma2 family endonuclease n=1 Tax=Tepidimonas sp. TaxID=2002775 RepID=UPI00391D9ABA
MKAELYRPLDEAEYLRLEARSPVRHEYVGGQIYAMTGASLRHNIIAGNVYTLLRHHLRGSPCRTFMADAKLRVAKQQSIYYPDVMVTCHPQHQQVGSEDFLVESPRLVVEVLSESTAGTDRREKLLAYRTLPSLQEYVLIAQDEALIEIYRREGDIGWQRITLTPGDPVEWISVELTTDFATIYEESGLALPPPA